jgi:hypothetical protein
LEAAHANASDVFIFWLAIAATLNDLFAKGSEKTGIARSLAYEVTAIFNKRYKEFFTNDIYFSAFALDPRQFSWFHCIVCYLMLTCLTMLVTCLFRIPTL